MNSCYICQQGRMYTHHIEQNKPDIRVYTLWFHSYKTQEQLKLFYGDRSQNSGYSQRVKLGGWRIMSIPEKHMKDSSGTLEISWSG